MDLALAAPRRLPISRERATIRRVEASTLKSRSKNTPFLGWTMKGRAIYTLVGGRIVYEAPRR